ncbi:MAG: DnaJ domain-containing protein [Ignavibacteriaceae bacterium]|nr:DnaJ domain-containing protein [Ignavibacteriaceae bacterium]
MAKFRTYYDNLNVSRNAPASVIRAAYKALCQKYHPDKYIGGHEEALRIMKSINNAYAVLSDSGKRAEHDQWIDQQERVQATDDVQRMAAIITQSYVAPPVTAAKPPAYLAMINKHLENVRSIGNKAWLSSTQLLKKTNGAFWCKCVACIVLVTAILYVVDLKTTTAPVNQDVADMLKKAKKLVKQGQVVKALPLYLQLAEQGNVDAQFYTGMIYAMGQGVAEDGKQAAEWFGKAAEQGHREAQTKLGFMYATGKGVAQNFSSAIDWFYKAAGRGDPTAQYNLGLIYAQGQGVAKDMSLAFSWYNKAAVQGDARAQYKLGDMYANGAGIEKNNKQAAVWYRKAAKQGVAEAVAALKQLDSSQ